MELWSALGFGAAVGALVGYLLGRRNQVPVPKARPAPPSQPPSASKLSIPANIKHVVLDDGSANVLNALNNRLSGIGALADLLHGSPLDPERARALVLLHGEVRRAAEITSHFLELAAHPAGAAEPCDAAIVVNGVLADRDSTFRELGVKIVRTIPSDLPMVACPMAQLTEMLTKLLDFSLRRLRASQTPRELRLDAIATGPSVVVSLWDSGTPLAGGAGQRAPAPVSFPPSGGGGAGGLTNSRKPAGHWGQMVFFCAGGRRQGKNPGFSGRRGGTNGKPTPRIWVITTTGVGGCGEKKKPACPATDLQSINSKHQC